MLARGTVLSRWISGSLTSFELAGSAREDQVATVSACARETARTSATFTKIGLQNLSQRPSSCSKEGLWPW